MKLCSLLVLENVVRWDFMRNGFNSGKNPFPCTGWGRLRVIEILPSSCCYRRVESRHAGDETLLQKVS
jgi:hypothetical protein